jgi:hypothetical protein
MQYGSIKKQVVMILMFSIILLELLSTQQAAGAADKYWIDQEVDCYDFCTSGSAMNWACAIGYDFSGGCVLPEDQCTINSRCLCRLVGYCYNREEAEKEKAACDEIRKKADEDCAPNGVKDFWCSNANVWGYECNEG